MICGHELLYDGTGIPKLSDLDDAGWRQVAWETSWAK